MKPFRFKLQSLETLREGELDRAMQDHATRLSQRAAAAAATTAAERELEENTVRWRDALRGGLSAHEFLQYEAAGTVIKSRVAQQRMLLGRAEEAVAASLVQLRLHQQKLESLEKLKVRHQHKHAMVEAAHEQRFLDDLAGRGDSQASQNLNDHA